MLVLLRRVDRRGWKLTYFDGGMRVPLPWQSSHCREARLGDDCIGQITRATIC